MASEVGAAGSRFDAALAHRGSAVASQQQQPDEFVLRLASSPNAMAPALEDRAALAIASFGMEQTDESEAHGSAPIVAHGPQPQHSDAGSAIDAASIHAPTTVARRAL